MSLNKILEKIGKHRICNIFSFFKHSVLNLYVHSIVMVRLFMCGVYYTRLAVTATQ